MGKPFWVQFLRFTMSGCSQNVPWTPDWHSAFGLVAIRYEEAGRWPALSVVPRVTQLSRHAIAVPAAQRLCCTSH